MYCIKLESRSKGYEAYFSEYRINGFEVVPRFVYLNEYTDKFKIMVYQDSTSVEEELDNLKQKYNMECQRVFLIEQLI